MDKLDSYLEKQYLYSKAYENAELYKSSDGKQTTKLKNIDSRDIKMLETEEILKDNGETFKLGKFEINLPNGEKVILTVDNNGKDMSCDFVDNDGNSQKFLLTPRMKKEIFKYQLETNLSIQELEQSLFPNSQEEMEKEIGKDSLIPKSAEETIKKIKEKNQNADVKEVQNLEKQNDEKKLEDENNEISLPENIKDKVQEVKENEGAALKHVLIAKNPSSVSEQLIDTAGLKDNGAPVYCLAFSNADLSTGNDRVIFVQGEKVVDERRYDKDASDMMNDHRNSSVVYNAEDKSNKIYYTDIDGHTTVADLVAEPKDLRREDKELLAEKLNDLEEKEEGIISSSNLTPSEKIEYSEKINMDRLELFKENGLKMPVIESEIKADLEIAQDAKSDIQEDEEQEKPQEVEKEDEEDDDRDPRESKHNLEKFLY